VSKTELSEKVNNLPRTPGIYKFFDLEGEVIYVGKAKDLRSRVRSYFQGNLDPASKTFALVSKISDVSYIEALSELEALILEAELIKQYQPKYNIALKDDKSYLYIVIRNERLTKDGRKMMIPKVLTARKPDIWDKDIVFGPYPDGRTAKYIVKTIRRIFPYRDCSQAKFTSYHKENRPCLYGDIGLCSAPCTDSVSVEDYRRQVERIRRFLSGDSVRIIKSLNREMNSAAKEEKFEKAAEIRDVIKKYDYIRQSFRTANKYIENPYLVEDTINRSLEELTNNIAILHQLPLRIECYDISNISGKEAVGSMVVATDGRIDKSQYRKFKIKLKNEPDDFRMMKEVLFRRLRNDWPLPDLIVLDGGKGQVSAGAEILEKAGSDIPVIGLAKRFETIVYLNEGEFTETVLSRDNEGLKLLQRLRDEAHRFAQRYHHELRMRKISS
jgi:excinuclease ABC subunit C